MFQKLVLTLRKNLRNIAKFLSKYGKKPFKYGCEEVHSCNVKVFQSTPSFIIFFVFLKCCGYVLGTPETSTLISSAEVFWKLKQDPVWKKPQRSVPKTTFL